MQPEKRFCEACRKEIPAKRLAAIPDARYCVACQERRDEYLPPPDFALASGGECDDETRIVESGWGQISEIRKTRTVKQPRVPDTECNEFRKEEAA